MWGSRCGQDRGINANECSMSCEKQFLPANNTFLYCSESYVPCPPILWLQLTFSQLPPPRPSSNLHSLTILLRLLLPIHNFLLPSSIPIRVLCALYPPIRLHRRRTRHHSPLLTHHLASPQLLQLRPLPNTNPLRIASLTLAPSNTIRVHELQIQHSPRLAPRTRNRPPARRSFK
jgi:hypothetical protein